MGSSRRQKYIRDEARAELNLVRQGEDPEPDYWWDPPLYWR